MRWNSPTIYNGWEQLTRHNPAREAFNLESMRDYMPPMGPMAGYAVMEVCEPRNARHREKKGAAKRFGRTGEW